LLINRHQIVMRLDAARVATLAELIEARLPLADCPVEWSRVNDHVRRVDALLANSPPRGIRLQPLRPRCRVAFLRCSTR
jgi:hypothetical protein